MGAGQHAHDGAGAGLGPRFQVAGGVPGHDHGRGVGHAQTLHGAEDQVGLRSAPADVDRREGQVDVRGPAQVRE